LGKLRYVASVLLFKGIYWAERLLID